MAKKIRKPSKYNKILREFTKINNRLPEEKKLSIQERRRIIKEQLLPQFSKVPYSRLRLKAIKPAIYKQIDKIPAKEACDINYLDLSDFALVEFFNLDETISQLVPDCVYVKVSAGEYGETNIFNTRDYVYSSKGVQDIVEAIRPDAEGKSGQFIFSAYKKLRPRKRNDGTPENYYLDFVLLLVDRKGNEQPQGSTEEVQYEPPKTRETRKRKTKARNLIEAKIKNLRSKKASRKRARKTLDKNLQKFSKLSKKASKNPTLRNRAEFSKQFNYSADLVEKYYKEGKLTKAQYDKAIQRIAKGLE
jgi:hypothetical protein